MTANGEDWIKGVLETLMQWKPLGFQMLGDGSYCIGHIPQIGELAYLHCIPAPLQSNEIDDLEDIIETKFPDEVRQFYLRANGLTVFSDSLTVHGYRKHYERGNYLAASTQPYSIELPNRFERPKGLHKDEIVIGSYSHDGSKVVVSLNGWVFRIKDNATNVLNRWPSFSSWLASEVRRLAKLFDSNGRCIAEERILPEPLQ